MLALAPLFIGLTIASASAPPVFPIPGPDRARTEFPEGRFGAYRPGHSARGCGRGHCGVDLSAPVGTPVVAVRDGKVGQVGSSGRGGRWLAVVHDDGTASWYFHLARVSEELRAGARVSAGEVVGILGRSGVAGSPTHLHFALTVGTLGHERHVDATPLLETAELLPAPLPR